MKIICAVDNNWNIGYDGRLLFQIPEDLKRFKNLTENNIVIMGRKTLESLPESKPLGNRINIVLTKNKDYKKDKATVVNSIGELEEILQCINLEKERQQFLIGGGEVISQLLDSCNTAYITKVYEDIKNADTKILNLDEKRNWEIIDKSDIKTYKGLNYQYITYKNKDI